MTTSVPRTRWRDRLFPGRSLVAAQVAPYAEAWRQHNASVMGGPEPLWVALGDSLSQGIGADTWQSGWLPTTARDLTELGRPYRVLNLSRTGATTHDVLDRQLAALADLDEEPSVVTLLVGANDIVHRRHRAGLVERWGAILVRLPDRSVIGLMPQPVPLAWRVNGRIRARGVATVGLRPAARPFRGHRAADLFHPNDLGHRRIADVWLEVLRTRPYP